MRNEISTPSPADALQVSRKGLFFVIGCGRSGTTLLQVMLDSHSEVVMPNETHFYSSFTREIRNVAVTSENLEESVDKMLDFEHIRPMNLDRDEVIRLARAGDPGWDVIFLAILTAFRQQRGGRRVGEKTPAHYQALWHLYDAFPEARFINLIRDPRAVVDSFMKAPFYRNFGKNPMHAIHSWRMAIDQHQIASSRADSRRYTSVRYEDLVERPREELTRICQFLDLPFEESMLEFHHREHSGFLSGESHKQGTFKPVYTDSTVKWRKSLLPAQVGIIEGILGSRMEALGYKLDSTARPVLARVQEKALFIAYKARMRARKAMQMVGILKRSDLGGIAAAASQENG
jgi:hypothetical protein